MEDGGAAQIAVHGFAVFVEEVRALLRVPDQPAFGGDDGVVPASFQGGADQAFGMPQAIGGRGIDQADAGVHGCADGVDGCGVIAAAPHPAAHGPGAQADGFAFDAGRAQCCDVHRSGSGP
ncbi:hypothetical protein G6F65_021973 [Rhizopus arrhizus]|nr:hypothetical protein G6F65_021973 [Rhizopus arrhizus]